jgi:hypothetical protein
LRQGEQGFLRQIMCQADSRRCSLVLHSSHPSGRRCGQPKKQGRPRTSSVIHDCPFGDGDRW